MTHLLSQVQLVCAQLEDDKITVRKVKFSRIAKRLGSGFNVNDSDVLVVDSKICQKHLFLLD
jgi:hypothetical protein